MSVKPKVKATDDFRLSPQAYRLIRFVAACDSGKTVKIVGLIVGLKKYSES